MNKEKFSFFLRWNSKDNRIKKVIGVSSRFALFLLLLTMLHFATCFTAFKLFELNLFWGEAAMKIETSDIKSGIISYNKTSKKSNEFHGKVFDEIEYTVMDEEDVALLYPSWKVDTSKKLYVEEQNLPKSHIQEWEYSYQESGSVISSPFQVIPYLQNCGYILGRVAFAYSLSMIFFIFLAVIAILLILLLIELFKRIFKIVVKGI